MSNLIDNFFSDYVDNSESNEKTDNIEYVIGIDLGTSNSCCGIWRNGKFEIIPDEYGNRTIPSIVAYSDNSVHVGNDAKNLNCGKLSKNLFYEMKRLIGKKIDDKTVINDKKFITYDIDCDNNKNIRVIVHNEKTNEKKFVSPEELSSYILIKLKNMASEYLKCPVKKAVISVPAYFNDIQRQATRNAATIAGLECIRIISEPIASALAFGLNKLSKKTEKNDLNVLVYDLGGGTLDVSLMTINDGVFEVIGSSGNTHLGGVDFDNRIYEYCINTFKSQYKDFDMYTVTNDMQQKLHNACENAKKILSSSEHTLICITEFYNNKNLMINLTRNKFNEICRDLLTLCLKPMDDVLVGCEINKTNIDEIILVGGMTRVPVIRDNVHKYFNKCPNSSVNPDEIVATGSAIQGYLITNKSDPFSESVTLLDTTPLTLGIETMGGVMNVMIPRGSLIPVSEKKMFTNDTPDETSVMIKIFEGERKLTKDNFYIGEFELSGLSPKPRGYHKIEVTFSIDVNGIVVVTAIDTNKKIQNEIRINCKCGHLSNDEITKMIEVAKQFEQTDKLLKKKRKMFYELTEICENIIKNVNSNNIHDSEKKMITDDIESVKKELNKSFDEIDMEFYNTQIQRLNKTYCVLTIKQHDDDINKNTIDKCEGYVEKQSDTCNVGTSVFQDDDNKDNQHETIDNQDNEGKIEKTPEEINEIMKIRDTLLENCHGILDITDSTTIDIQESDRQKLKDYVENIIVWIHVQQNSSISEYTNKMNELTDFCNECIGNNIISQEINPRDELLTLCNSLKSSIDSDLLALQEYDMTILNRIVDETLELINTKSELTDDDYRKKILFINEHCNKINDKYTNNNFNCDKC